METKNLSTNKLSINRHSNTFVTNLLNLFFGFLLSISSLCLIFTLLLYIGLFREIVFLGMGAFYIFAICGLFNLAFLISVQWFAWQGREHLISTLINITQNIFLCFLFSPILIAIIASIYGYVTPCPPYQSYYSPYEWGLMGILYGLYFAIFFSPAIATLALLIKRLDIRKLSI